MGPDETPDITESAPQFSDPFHIAGRHQNALRESMPEWIGPYRILEVLGEGGMGVVYLAEQDQPIHRRVALKVIKLGMDTKRTLARFETEREALALMSHPNVARVLEAGATEQGRPYFVMEHVPGIAITDYCDQHRLTTEARLRLFKDVCHAVQHAHQKGIIHRDLKPSNVLVSVLDDRPVPKVIDFGVAKATQQRLTERTFFTELGQLLGTPGYMSPEQAEMSPLDIDTRTDIYSLGVMLYELLVGTLPFDTRTLRQAAVAEIQRVIREVEPPKPSTRLSSMGAGSAAIARMRNTEARTLIRQLRGDLDRVIMKCLEKGRTRRYETANGLALEIQRFLDHEPVLAQPPSATYRLRKFLRRNRVAVAGATLFAIVLLLGVIGTTWGVVSARVAERSAQEHAVEAQLVTSFLCNVIAAADPWKTGGRDVPVREVLDKADQFITTGLAGFPLLEADLRLSLGKTYAAIGLYAEAERHLPLALQMYRRLLGESDIRTIRSMVQVGFLYSSQGRYDEARAVAEQAIAVARRGFGDAHAETFSAMNLLGDVTAFQGRLPEAIALRERMLELARQSEGGESPRTIWQMNRLAMIYSEAGRYAEAVVLFERVRDLRSRITPQRDVLKTTQQLAATYLLWGRHADAVAFNEQTLEGQRRVLGERHPDTVLTMEGLASSYCRTDRFAEAVELQEQAVAVYRHIMSDEHDTTLTAMLNLAAIYRQAGRDTDARTVTGNALGTARRLFGDTYPVTVRAMMEHALALLGGQTNGDNDPAEALSLASTAAATHEAVGRADLYEYLDALAQAQHANGDVSAAIQTELRAISSAPQEGPAREELQRRLERWRTLP